MEYRLKPEVIRQIIVDGTLYGKVAKAMNIQADSLVTPLRKNSDALTKKKILKVISDYLGIAENDLMEEIEENETV
jgi:hypothetical protein